MIRKEFRKYRSNITQQIERRWKLLKPIIQEYHAPVIVHAIKETNTFQKILKEGVIKIPSHHNSPKKTPYLETFLGIDNGIYYSLGFVYACAYHWKYSLMFDSKYIKEVEYYDGSVNFQIGKQVINWWYEHDKAYLKKLENKNATTKKVFKRWYTEEYKGKVREIIEIWKIEKEIYEHIKQYKQKRKVLKLIQKIGKEKKLTYPASRNHAQEAWKGEKAPEMVRKTNDNLHTNPYFKGFYIEGTIPLKIKKILKEEYSTKIIYDGKTIKPISSL